jgi:hypothetical protein
MSVINRIKHLMNFSASASGATSVATSPYQFTGIGTNSLFATTASIGNTTPITSTFTSASVVNITLLASQIFLNGTTNTFNFIVNTTAAATSSLCVFEMTLQNRTSTNTNTTDIYGMVNGYNGNNTPLTGITVYADTTSSNVVVKYVSNGTTNQIIQGQLVYFSN